MSIRIGTAVHPLAQRAAPLFLIAFGMAALATLGFAPNMGIHEFVHDGRHLLAFPCH